jgi:hypothetical protein
VRFASSFRRPAGLLAAATVGMSTAVLTVAGTAHAAVPTYSVSGSGVTAAVPAGICGVAWTVIGGSGGADSDVTPGGPGGQLVVVMPAAAGDVFTLRPGTAGADGVASTSGAAGGTNGNGIPADQGAAGGLDADSGAGTGGGGAASTVSRGSTVILRAFGGAGYGVDGGAGGGGTENDASGATPYLDFDPTLTAEALGDGAISGEGIACAPATPNLGYADELDQALELQFSTMDDGDVPTDHFEYTEDAGDTWSLLDGVNDDDEDGILAATVDGLTNGTEYTVSIRAVGAGGELSDESDPVTGTPHKKATAPSNLTVVTGDGSLTVSWGASTAGTYPIAGYGVALVWTSPNGQSGGGTEFCQTSPTVFTCTAPAQPGVTHRVVVVAVDSTDRHGEPAEATSGVVPASSVLPESDGDLTLPPGTKASVAAGKTITVSGSGYAPFSTVTVLVYSQPQILTTVVTDATGSFSVEVTVPAGLAAGQHHLVAAGVDPNGELRYLTLPITVTDGGATLAYTGADVVVPAVGGLLAVLVGAGLLLVARRRPAN